jgi:hypothetical protein
LLISSDSLGYNVPAHLPLWAPQDVALGISKASFFIALSINLYTLFSGVIIGFKTG